MNKEAFIACSILSVLWITTALLIYIDFKVFLISNGPVSLFVAGFQALELVILALVTVKTYKVLTDKTKRNDN